MILLLMAKVLNRHARLLRSLFGDVAEDDSGYRESIRWKSKQINHPLRVAANSADWDDAETEGARRSHECRHRNSCVAHRGEDRLQAALHYLLGTCLLDPEACFIQVSNHRDKHWSLCDPWLPTGDFCDASTAGRIAYDDKRNLLAVDGSGSTMCGLNDGIKNLHRKSVTLITAAAIMGLQQAYGFIHDVSSIQLALAWLQALSKIGRA